MIVQDRKETLFTARMPENIPEHLNVSLTRRIVTVALAVFTLGVSLLIQKGLEYLAKRSFMMAAYISEKTKNELHTQRTAFLETYPQAKEVFFNTFDGAKINGIQINPPGKDPLRDKSQETAIIFFCGMGSLYERYLSNDAFIQYAKQTDSTILLFNYRSVLKSEGSPAYGKDVVIDGDAALQFLMDQGFQKRKVLLHGYSLGGGISSQVALMNTDKLDPKNCPPYLNEKSFESSASAVAALKGAFLGTLVYLAHWNLPAYKLWEEKNNQSKKALIVHKEDYMIPYREASLYKTLRGYLGFKKVAKNEENEKAIIIKTLAQDIKSEHTKVYFETYKLDAAKPEITTHCSMLFQGQEAIKRISDIALDLFQE